MPHGWSVGSLEYSDKQAEYSNAIHNITNEAPFLVLLHLAIRLLSRDVSNTVSKSQFFN